MDKLTHFDENGNAIMIDITNKNATQRTATAVGQIITNSEIIDHVVNNKVEKGDVLNVARIAGIMAIKKTSELIPMCHQLNVSHAKIDFEVDEVNNIITTYATVKVAQATGVEMEALTGVNIALLTIYDMCKAIDKSMEITGVKLLKKTGGKSGTYVAE